MNSHIIGRGPLGDFGDLVGKGGQAKVYLAPEASLPDVPGPLVYKEYRPGHAPPHGLHAVVARRQRMDAAARERLDRLTVWPVRVVEEGGAILGVLMRLIPDDYFERRSLPSGTPVRSLREVQHLFIDPRRSLRFGMPPASFVERITVLRDFAAAVHLLHRNDLVIGDVNAKNAVFRLSARPAVLLVDCDAIRIKGTSAVVRQLNAPDWDPPEDSLSQATDLYKFGLMVLRCLCPGEQASTFRDPHHLDGVLDAEGCALLRDSLSRTAASRTTAQTWGRYFDRLLNVSTDSRPQRRTETTVTSGWRRDPATGDWIPAA